MAKTSLITLLMLCIAQPSFAAERFSGSAKLSANTAQTSANARFSVTAQLQALPGTPKTTADGRFSVLAELAAPKAALTACGASTDSFRNGFEKKF